jgi:hypothetical protein
MVQWIDGGAYKSWTCEPSLRPALDNSPHGQARVCQNALLVNAGRTTEPFPLGAASVKEQGDSGNVELASVVVRGNSQEGGAGWYWWRRNEVLGNVLLSGFGVSECTACHESAPRDLVFTRLE